MPFSVSFRIPFTVLGHKQYLNGAAFTRERLTNKDILVRKHGESSPIQAQVIEHTHTKRVPSSFDWVIAD